MPTCMAAIGELLSEFKLLLHLFLTNSTAEYSPQASSAEEAYQEEAG